MKYKTILFLILLLIFNFGYAQDSNKTELFLEYNITYNLGKTVSKKGYVFKYDSNKYFFTGKSFFKENLIQKEEFDSITNTRSINLVSAGDGSESLITNIFEKKLTENRSFGNDILKVKEYFQEMKWIDSSRRDSIMNYECKIFELDFRGRHYIAYVASELEKDYSFGPWKFNGFEGVPLLIYDTENKLRWEVFNIKRLSKQELSEYAKEIENRQQKLREVDIQYFMELYDMTDGGMTFAKGYPNLGSDFKKVKDKKQYKRRGLELVFEWEE